MDRYESAQQHLELALRIAPKDRTARTELARLLVGRRKNPEARQLLERLISESDTEPELHLLLARVFQSEGDAAASGRERSRFMELSRGQQSAGGMSSTIASRKTQRFADSSQ
jgi:predicted Zn-dependent protease